MFSKSTAGDCQLLSELPLATGARVISLPVRAGDFARLRAMGVCEGRRVRVIQHGSRMIIAVAGIRVGLDRELAARIEVQAE